MQSVPRANKFWFLVYVIAVTTINPSLGQHDGQYTLSRIRPCSKWSHTGETIVGSKSSTRLNDLESIAITGIDTLYTVDRSNGRTRLQAFASGSLVGRTLWTGFESIVFIDVDGTFYTASYDGHIQRWLENAAKVEKINCRCRQCSRVWFDAEQQDLYMVERFRSHVLKCHLNTTTTTVVAGRTDIDGSSNETLSYPYALYVNDAKDIYVADVNNQRVQKWMRNATAGITVAGQTGKVDSSNASLHRPYDVLIDNNGFIYIADTINHRILRWKEGQQHGEVLCGISGESGRSNLHLDRPKSLAFDSDGNLYVADVGNGRVQKFAIDNRACLAVESPGSRWSLIHRLPDVAKLGHGYNPLKDSPICYTGLCSRRSFALPIFKLNDSMPSARTDANKSTVEKLNIETHIIRTLRDLRQSTRRAVDFATDRTLMGAHVNASFSYAYSSEIHAMIEMMMMNSNVTILVTSVNSTLAHLSIAERKPALSDEFRQVLEHLPCCTMNDTVERYIRKMIIGYFGYTYINEVHFGGLVQQTIALTANDRARLEQQGFNASDETWLKDVAKEIFLAGTKGKLADIHNRTLVDTVSRYFTKMNRTVLGGKRPFRSLEKWYKTIAHNPVVVKIGVASILGLLTTNYFPADGNIHHKAALVQSVIDRYLSSPVYCYNQCTDSLHGMCLDSGYFSFGVCQCRSGWTGSDCAIPVRTYTFLSTSVWKFYLCVLFILDRHIHALPNSTFPIFNTRAGRNSQLVSNSFGSGSSNVSSQRSGCNTGFYLTFKTDACIVMGFQFTTATSHPNGDPKIVTMEGSNANESQLISGASWTLLYNGSSGLETDPGRGKAGSLQVFNGSRPYRSYRVLVVSKRGIESGVHYSKFAFYGHSCLPGIPRPTTSALMTVTNDYPHPLVSTTSINLNMNETFPSQTIAAGRISPPSYISTGWAMFQSHFDLTYRSNAIRINMGQESDVSVFGSRGQAGALLAPTKLFSNETDYRFYLFAGPGILPPLINSFIAANLPAIIAYVSANPLHIDLSDDIKLTIKQLDLTPQSTQCTYAALSHARSQSWHINMILTLNVTMSGSITYHGMSFNLNVTIVGGSVLMQALVHIGGRQAVSCTVTRLAFSILNFSINPDLLMLVKTLFSTWYKLIDTPYHLASTLNVKYNTILVDKLNVAISKLINATSFNKSMAIKTADKNVHTVKQTNTDRSRWMSNPKIQSKLISQLRIPGTHNSGSYGLTRTLSQITYEDIQFLWSVSADPAPTNGQLPFSKEKIYVGRVLYDYVMDTALRMSIAHNRTIRQQLVDGIRFFDLRVYYDTDGSFYIQHGLRGPRLDEILGQVRSFLDAHSTSGELVFLAISHTNFGENPETLPARVSKIIQSHLKPFLYIPANASGVKNFNFQSLDNTTLSSITASGSHGTSPKVIVLNTDNAQNYYYKDTVVNTGGFLDSGRWRVNSNGVGSVAELIKVEGQGLERNSRPMYQISWTQTPQIMDVIQNTASHLSGRAPTMLLKQLASEANAALGQFLRNHTTGVFTLVTMDWYETGSTADPVNMIIELN